MKINKRPIFVATRIRLTLTLLVLLTQLSYSQNNQLVFDHYGLDAGFTAKEARDIVLSKNGMVWISSNNGLVRYDSKRFKFYQNIEGDSNSISGNICGYLEIDKRGLVWISCKDNVDVFDPVTENFRHIKIPYNHKKAKWQKSFDINLQYDAVSDIMWIPTKNGLFFCKDGSLKPQSINSITQDSTLISDPIFSVLPVDANNIWVASGLKFISLNTKTGAIQKYMVPEKIGNALNDEKFSYIKCLYLDKEKTLWLGTWRNGLIAYNTALKKFSQFFIDNNSLSTNTIFDIRQTKDQAQKNVLYISALGNGFSTFDINTKKFQSYKSIFTADINGIKGNTYSIHIDVPGSAVWIASETGLHKLDLTKQLFKSVDLSSLAKGLSLSPVNVMAVEKSNTGADEKLWIKIPDKGTYVCDLRSNNISVTPPSLVKYLGNSFDFFDFFIDSKNRLWISNNKYGLICYNINTDKIIIQESKYFFDKTDWVIIFFEDKSGIVWVGSRKGLFYFDEERALIVEVPKVNEMLQKQNLAVFIQGVTEDGFGNLWFATDESNKNNACIGKYNFVKNQCEIVFDETKNKGLLCNAVSINDIAVAGNDVFVCDNNNGLLWFDATQKNAAVKKIANNSTINSNEFTSIIARGNKLWCNTNFGVAFYNTGTQTFTNYSYTNYAIGTRMQPAIYLSAQSGNLYVGQSNAINYFNTTLLKENPNSSKLVFTEIKLFDDVYRNSNATVSDGDELTFTHSQNSISVEFALLSYANANDNLYSWKLEGLEKAWNVSKNNIATYYQLNPGKYTLLVKAANNNGVWTEKSIKLHVIIKPPVYKTWWFILFFICCVIATVLYFVQQKIKRIKEKYQLRNKIASDLHDEIGSTLTSISILSGVSQQAMALQPLQAREMLQQIATQSKNIQQNMSDIVWSIRPDNEKIENLVVCMREFAVQTLEPLNIDTSIAADENLVQKVLPMQYRKDILLIYKEAINNITKHANATTVKILFTSGRGKIILSITDNGTWKGNNSGTGTKTMQERAKAIGGQFTIANSEHGTQILLTVPIT